MKKINFLLCFLISINVFAVEKELSPDARDVASILLNKQLSECTKQFQSVNSVILNITKDEIDDKNEVLKISGIILMGGDMVTGNVQMTIETKYVPYGFGQTPLHACKVEIKKF